VGEGAGQEGRSCVVMSSQNDEFMAKVVSSSIREERCNASGPNSSRVCIFCTDGLRGDQQSKGVLRVLLSVLSPAAARGRHLVFRSRQRSDDRKKLCV